MDLREQRQLDMAKQMVDGARSRREQDCRRVGHGAFCLFAIIAIAGLVLLLSRPFSVGEAIQLRSGAMGGLIEGTVTEIGITYLRLDSADGPHVTAELTGARGLRGPIPQALATGQPGADGASAPPAPGWRLPVR